MRGLLTARGAGANRAAQVEPRKSSAAGSARLRQSRPQLTSHAVAALARLTAAEVAFSSPIAATDIQGGRAFTARWINDGKAPSNRQFGEATFRLCVGGRFEQTCVQTLGTADVSKASSATFTIDPKVGPSSPNSYFIRVRRSCGCLD